MINTQVKIFLFISLLLLTGNAIASPMGGDYWEFNAYANTEAVSAMLRALSSIIASGSFQSIYVGLAILGLAISAGTGLIGGNPKKLIGYFMGFVLLTYAIFGLKVTVFVKEMVYISGTGQSGHNIVEGVPGAIAIPLATISYIGTGLTDLLEYHMRGPNQDLPEGVLPFGAKTAITKDMTELRITDPNIARNFKEWVSKCALPRLVSRQMSMNEMANSTDLMGYFKNSVAGKSKTTFVQFYSSRPDAALHGTPYDTFDGIFSCQEGIRQLEEEIKDNVGGSLNQISKRLYPQYTQDAILSSDVASMIAGDLLGKSSETATGMAVQGAVVDVVNGVGQYQAEVLGADATLLAMNINNAERSQKTGWYTASVLFRDMSSYMYAAIQLFLMGITPMIIILMLMPGMGAKLGGSYMKAVVWLASWWPALHIVNFMMESYYTNSATNVYSGPDEAMYGLSLMNAGASTAFTDNMIIAIGFMATLVPTLMWGIINGTGMALTSMLDRASGAQYATGAAQDAAAGNFRAGNISTNTYSANKYDDMQTRVTGRAPVSENYAGSGVNQSTDLGGQGVSLHGKAVDKSISESQARRLSDAREQVDTSKEALSNAVTSAATQSAKELSTYGQSATIGKNGDVNFGNQETASGAIQNIQQLAHAARWMEDEQFKEFQKAQGELGVNVTRPDGKNGILKIGTTGVAGEESSQAMVASVATDGSMTFANQNGEAVNLTYGEGSGSSITAADVAASQSAYEKSDSYATIESRVQSFEQAESHAKKVSDDVSREQSITVGQGVDQQDIRNVNNGEDPNMLIRNVDKDRGGDVPVSKVSNNAQVAGGALISGAQNQVDALFSNALGEHNDRRDARVAENLAPVNVGNKSLVENEVIKPAVDAFRNGESNNQFGAPNPDYLNQLQPFSIGGNKFDPAGMVKNKEGDDFEMVYRTENSGGEHQYYAVGDDGSMARLNNLEHGDKGQVFFSGAQINQFDNHAIGELARQDVPLTVDNVRAYQESLKGHNFGFGDSVSIDAGSNISSFSDLSVLERFPAEGGRSTTGIHSHDNSEYGTYMQMHIGQTYQIKK